MYREKVSAEVKIALVKRYMRGEGSIAVLSKSVGVSSEAFRTWLRNYESNGTGVFFEQRWRRYSAALKESAVRDYLSGNGSQDAICKKYGIRSRHQLQIWIMKYNGHEKLKTTGTGGRAIVTKGRKTTFEERISIVADCIESGLDYNATAEKFHVSYQQFYTWVRKQKEKGIDGLKDGRGRKKPEEEMSKLERLRLENRIQKAQLLRQQMEIDFLKKLKELERE